MHIRRLPIVCALIALVATCAEPPASPPDAAPPPDGPTQADIILAGYDQAARTYEADHPDLPAGWADWMIAHKDGFTKPYVRARTDRRLRIAVAYLQPIAYDPPWTDESEHFAALERMMESSYPGWDFSFSADDPDAEFTIYLGDPAGSYADGNTVHLLWEGILPHEFGHELGLGHHYCDVSLQPCEATPPGEFEAKCIMSRNSGTWGPAEQFVLNLGQQRFDDRVDAAMTDLNGRYPRGWPNVPGFAAAKTCPAEECLQDRR